jgi:hypothetical protein
MPNKQNHVEDVSLLLFLLLQLGEATSLWTAAANGPIVYPPVNMEYLWNDNKGEKLKDAEKNLFQWHSVNLKSHCPMSKPRWREPSD